MGCIFSHCKSAWLHECQSSCADLNWLSSRPWTLHKQRGVLCLMDLQARSVSMDGLILTIHPFVWFWCFWVWSQLSHACAIQLVCLAQTWVPCLPTCRARRQDAPAWWPTGMHLRQVLGPEAGKCPGSLHDTSLPGWRSISAQPQFHQCCGEQPKGSRGFCAALHDMCIPSHSGH